MVIRASILAVALTVVFAAGFVAGKVRIYATQECVSWDK